MFNFMGESIDFWITLKARSEGLGACDLITEIASLRSKVSFYESRIDQMNKFMQTRLEVKKT